MTIKLTQQKASCHTNYRANCRCLKNRHNTSQRYNYILCHINETSFWEDVLSKVDLTTIMVSVGQQILIME